MAQKRQPEEGKPRSDGNNSPEEKRRKFNLKRWGFFFFVGGLKVKWVFVEYCCWVVNYDWDCGSNVEIWIYNEVCLVVFWWICFAKIIFEKNLKTLLGLYWFLLEIAHECGLFIIICQLNHEAEFEDEGNLNCLFIGPPGGTEGRIIGYDYCAYWSFLPLSHFGL
jgi:hypothetical protein